MTPLGYFLLSATLVVVVGLVCFAAGRARVAMDYAHHLGMLDLLTQVVGDQPSGEPLVVSLTRHKTGDGRHVLEVTVLTEAVVVPGPDED